MPVIVGRTATVVENASATSITATLPGDIASGDLVVVAFALTCSPGSITAPSGWTQLFAPFSVPDSSCIAAYYRFDPPAGATISTSDPANRVSALCQAYGGVDPTTPIDVSAVTSVTAPYGTSLAATGVTTVTADALLLSACLVDSSTTGLDVPSGMTSVADATGGGVGRGIRLAQELRNSTGATGTRTWTTNPSTSLGLGAFVVALRPVSMTGTRSQTWAISGATLELGLSGALSETFSAASGALLLSAGATGSRAETFSASGGLGVTSRHFTGLLEIELTAGVWTDITSYLSFRAPLTIRQGRATEYDDVSPGLMTFQLWNDDGRFMPENTTSAYYPNFTKGKRVRWKITKQSVTYTRFVGWIQAITPDFPSASTYGALVTVTAVDALGLLAQRKLRSNFTEIALWRARNDGTTIDIYEASGKPNGLSALLTNYSTDTGRQASGSTYLLNDATLSFGTDRDMSIGGIVSSQNTATSCKTRANFQANPLQINIHVKCPSRVGTVANLYLATLHNAVGGGSPVNVLVMDFSGANNQIVLRDSANTTDVGVLGTVPFGQWVRIWIQSRAANAARSDWWVVYSDGTGSSLSDQAIDIRNIRCVEIPGDQNPPAEASWGGIAALGTRTSMNASESWVSASAGTISSRVTSLTSAVNQLPITITQTGTLTTQVLTGEWSDRTALDVLTEMLRTGSGLAWARSRDSTVYAIGSDTTYPSTVIASVDTDGDCVGSPRLVDGAESKPTRVDVDWPGAVATAVDTTSEASGFIRSRRITTVAASGSIASDAGSNLLSRLGGGLRISQVTIDLFAGVVDHTAVLFSESGALSGLYPSQRIRLYLPSSHFGVASRDVHIQGWEESYAPQGVTVRLDTTPAQATTLATETWTGANGSAWAAQWIAGATGAGATVDIQGNAGRIIVGAGDFTSRRIDGLSRADVEITCTITPGTGGEAGVFWRETGTTGDTASLQLGLIAGGEVTLWRVTSGSYSLLESFGSVTGGTAYGVRVRQQGKMLQVRVWAAAGSEPGTWDIEREETTYTSPGSLGVYGFDASSTHAFDSFQVTTGA